MNAKFIKASAKALMCKIRVWPLHQMLETARTAAPISIQTFALQKIIGFNRAAYWPTHFTSSISSPQNIEIGIGTAPGLSPNCYIQGRSGIKIGDYTLVGPGVGIISANHEINNIYSHSDSRGVVIGRYCWIGMNAVILPGVRLGDHTIVAASAVVTKAHPHGYCILAGNPARPIKALDKQKVVESTYDNEYIGYMSKERFKLIRDKLLKLKYDEAVDAFIS